MIKAYYTHPVFLATIAEAEFISARPASTGYDDWSRTRPSQIGRPSAFRIVHLMDRYIDFVGNNPILFILLAAIVALIVWTEWRRLMRAHKEVSPVEAVQLINREDALVLDVRENNELKSGKINGAKHISLSVLRERVGELAQYRDRAVIVYCGTGVRSTRASDILRKNQFQKLYSLKGGLAAWQTANLPLVKK
jgi:rhodanese-related sulfurtransferase